MALLAFDIPDRAEDLAPWLERHVIGEQLSLLVAELSAVHGASSQFNTLDEVLNGELPAVLEGGLSNLSTERVEMLLTHPQLLLELQERVFINGGAFWETITEISPTVEGAVQRGRQRLLQLFPPPPRPVARAGRAWRLHPALVSLTTAALVLVGVFLWQAWILPPRPVAQGWGWQRPGALDNQQSREEYLRSLAQAAEEWHNKPTPTRAALAQRMLQFRQGCSTLIFAEHKPLSVDDRKWLVERCRTWGAKLDQHLQDLERGEDLAVVEQAVDGTVNKLIRALKQRINDDPSSKTV